MSNIVRFIESPKHYLTFNGKDFRDFGVYCNGTDTYTIPQHEYETVQIPGRNGDFKRDLDRFQEVTVPYDCWIGSNFDTNIKAMREYIAGVVGYTTLEDTYHPDTYRKAIYEGPTEVKVGAGLSFGSFTLNFNCKPERWLKVGDTEVVVTNGSVVKNPTNFIARPLLKLIGHGTITVTNGTWSCTLTVATNAYEAAEYTIDMERLFAISSAGVNMNQYVTPNDRNNWITLKPGNNTITFTGFTSVKIIPRWWTI